MSLEESLTRSPPKMTLVRVDNPALSLTAQFNPEEFTEAFGSEWGKLTVPGLSHQVKQFSHSKETQLKFTLRFISANSTKAQEALLANRLFLKGATRPKAGTGMIRTAGAPRLLFMWPGFFSLTGYLESAVLRYQRFNQKTGVPVDYTAECAIEEIRDTLITSDEFFREDP